MNDRYLSTAIASSIVLASSVPSSGIILFTFSSSGISRWLFSTGIILKKGKQSWHYSIKRTDSIEYIYLGKSDGIIDDYHASQNVDSPLGLSSFCSCCCRSFCSVSSIWARVTFPPDSASFWALPFNLEFSSSRRRWFSFFLSSISSRFFSLSSYQQPNNNNDKINTNRTWMSHWR